jgi:flagellar protein FliO/FliZ
MQALTFFFAFVAVLALIGVAAWLVRRFASNRLGANTNRSRMPRLAVIDAAAVDGRRRLVLVRRDNIEHLLMIGGPTDIVVEPNIVRATPGRDQVPPRPGLSSPEPQVRVAPQPEPAGWVNGESHRGEVFEHGEPQMPEPPPRPVRPPFADEARRGTPERRSDRSDALTGFAPEPISGRAEPRVEPAPPRMPRSEPLIPRPARETAKPAFRGVAERAAAQPSPPPPQAQPMSPADQNLAEMAQRLEAALRRPAGDQVAPPVAPEPPPARPASRSEPPAPPPAPPTPPPAKSGFENLEDEMASLLGRPKNLS